MENLSSGTEGFLKLMAFAADCLQDGLHSDVNVVAGDGTNFRMHKVRTYKVLDRPLRCPIQACFESVGHSCLCLPRTSPNPVRELGRRGLDPSPRSRPLHHQEVHGACLHRPRVPWLRLGPFSRPSRLARDVHQAGQGQRLQGQDEEGAGDVQGGPRQVSETKQCSLPNIS